ncbi:MAG: hypothetical protein ACJAVB_001220 [Cyclobacteriaceae bacterium]|jgi:uncharacterized protein (TIGR00661 family)
MKIAYAVMGDGRGHVMRFLTLAPYLKGELLVFAGGDAYDFLKRYDSEHLIFRLIKIPAMQYQISDGKILFVASFFSNLKQILDFKLNRSFPLRWRGVSPITRYIQQEIAAFDPDLIVSDSEFYVQHVRRKAPLVLLDRYSKIAFCRPNAVGNWSHRLQRSFNNLSYRFLMGRVDHVIATSFYPAQPLHRFKKKVSSFGPIIRDGIRSISSSEGQHVVVYATHSYIYSDHFLVELSKLNVPVVIYGAKSTKDLPNLLFKDIDPQEFIQDAASSAYIIATPGNMLISEMGYLGKKMILIRTTPLEQREGSINALKIGIAQVIEPRDFTAEKVAEKLRKFKPYDSLHDESEHIANKLLSFTRNRE